jgi:hypothetical protein
VSHLTGTKPAMMGPKALVRELPDGQFARIELAVALGKIDCVCAYPHLGLEWPYLQGTSIAWVARALSERAS